MTRRTKAMKLALDLNRFIVRIEATPGWGFTTYEFYSPSGTFHFERVQEMKKKVKQIIQSVK